MKVSVTPLATDSAGGKVLWRISDVSDERLEQELPALFIIVVATGRAKQRLLGRVVHV